MRWFQHSGADSAHGLQLRGATFRLNGRRILVDLYRGLKHAAHRPHERRKGIICGTCNELFEILKISDKDRLLFIYFIYLFQ